jgi:hypothetical protein
LALSISVRQSYLVLEAAPPVSGYHREEILDPIPPEGGTPLGSSGHGKHRDRDILRAQKIGTR